MSRRKRTLLWAAFLFWCLWLLWMLLFRRLDSASALPLAEYAREKLVLVPLRTVSAQMRGVAGGDLHAISNLGGNTFLFVPVGWALPVLIPGLRKFGRFLAVFAAVIAVVELSQLFLRVGVCELDDLLLNCLGASAGFLVWKLFFGKEKKA